MGQVPNLPIVIIKDLILTVVLDHVLGDEVVIDDLRSHRFLVLFNLLLRLELLLDMRLHVHSWSLLHFMFLACNIMVWLPCIFSRFT